MRDNGKEDARWMRDNEKEDARKKGRGADKRGGAHSRYQFFQCGKIGGGRINDGGRSGGTLRYKVGQRDSVPFATLVEVFGVKINICLSISCCGV